MAERNPAPDDQPLVFISYSRRDLAFVDRLQAGLEKRGIAAFVDREAIAKGEEWWARIQQLIGEADTIVFVLSPDSVGSEVCQAEIDHAQSFNKRFVPVVARDITGVRVPDALAQLNYIFFVPQPAVGASGDFDTAADELAAALETDIGWIREHTRLGVLAQRWLGRGRSGALLLRGAELEAAENWIAAQPSKAPAPTPAHQALVGESRRTAARRQRNWLAGALAAVIIAGGLAIWSEINRRVAVAERNRVERVLERTTEATRQLVVDVADHYAPRKGIPKQMIVDILSQARKLVDELESVGENRPTLLLNGGLALADLSAAMRAQGQTSAALETAEATVAVFRKLRATAPDDASWQSGLAVGLDRLGDMRLELGQQDLADAAYHEGLEVARLLPVSDARNRQIAVAEENIGNALFVAGKADEALARFREALALWQGLADDGDDTERARAIAAGLERVGDVAASTGDADSAIASYRDSLAATEALAARDRANTDWQQDLATAHQKLGDALMALGKGDDALAQFERHVAIARALHQSDPQWRPWRRSLMVAHERLGDAAHIAGKPRRAQAALEAALTQAQELARAETAGGGAFDDLSRLMRSTALAAFEIDGAKAALTHVQNSLSSFAHIAGDTDSKEIAALEAPLYSDAAWFSLLSGDFAGALGNAGKARDMQPDAVLYQSNLAHALMFLGRKDEARAIYLRHKGEPIYGGLDWQAYIASDFKALRESGHDHPMMDEILGALR
ncbi:MAG: toll/interleukin-1 receptor domain-containing protein [Rhodobiaceae bacterium]|nr:toll/interleukin-1 receptor domain-containing protein [Rhodobiaceae bacterium]MCC0041423.1 toll/interleukin-1 receptor domain-containing protein [Rhodobiaceae bacterium]